MPPVGQNWTCGMGAPMAARYDGPPAGPAGKNFIASNPASRTAITSPTVATPGSTGTSRDSMEASRAGVMPGLTRNLAPDWTAASAWPGVRMVPAPTRMSGTSWAISFSEVSAESVRSVSSMIFTPPATRARARGTASWGSSMVTTGMTGETLRTPDASAMVDLISQAQGPVVDAAVPVQEQVPEFFVPGQVGVDDGPEPEEGRHHGVRGAAFGQDGLEFLRQGIVQVRFRCGGHVAHPRRDGERGPLGFAAGVERSPDGGKQAESDFLRPVAAHFRGGVAQCGVGEPAEHLCAVPFAVQFGRQNDAGQGFLEHHAVAGGAECVHAHGIGDGRLAGGE